MRCLRKAPAGRQKRSLAAVGRPPAPFSGFAPDPTPAVAAMFGEPKRGTQHAPSPTGHAARQPAPRVVAPDERGAPL
eukprot:12538551-Alexandrium_andersonii.AAC.1